MLEDPTKKMSYIPSQKFRYELSGDKYSRERFAAIVKVYKEVQALMPDIPISFSIFGSLTKGKNLNKEMAETTDVDFEVFYDREAAKVSENLKFDDIENEKERLRKFIDNKLWEVKNLKIVHFRISAIDNETIPYELHVLYKQTKPDPNPPTTEEELEKTRFRIALLFGLSIGTVLEKYRNQFLKWLAEHKDKNEAEEAWQKIKECVEHAERKGEIPEVAKYQFPQTLSDALKLYGVQF